MPSSDNGSLVLQNVVAVIWDFDKTLIQGNMQDPLFRKCKVNPKKFWEEVNGLVAYYRSQGITVNPDTIYLNHMITYALEGRFPELNNEMLRSLGKKQKFCDGVLELLPALKRKIADEPEFQKHGITLEHYVVSTGLAQIIHGSAIAEHVDGIWGCELIDQVAPPNYKHAGSKQAKVPRLIRQIAYPLDSTAKTRAIFEISKGTNRDPRIDINAKIEESDRRVPIRNMIYIADGPSDVPSWSVVRSSHGKCLAVYQPGDEKMYDDALQLLECGRVHFTGRAVYTPDSETAVWITYQTRRIAERIVRERDYLLEARVSNPPKH